MTDNYQNVAMRGPAESVMTRMDQQNAGGLRRQEKSFVYYDQAPLSEYPRMMYRKTDVEQTQIHAGDVPDLKDEPMVINRFDGLLCETTVAHSADEAEALSSNGWDVTPKAAYGVEDGLIAATSAKDDRIAELEAQLAAMASVDQEPEQRRGPGRPPKVVDAATV